MSALNHSIVRVACLGLFCGLVLSGCGGSNYAPVMSKSSREAKMQEVRKFDAFRVYYAGKEVAGLPLTEISGEESGRELP